MATRRPARPRRSESVALCGLDSSYSAEILETLARLGIGVAAGILMDKSQWSMRGFRTVLRQEEVSDLLVKLPLVFSNVAPKRRQASVTWALARGFTAFPRVVDPLAHISPSAYVETGVSVAAGSTLGAATELDRFVLVNRQASIGHHSVLEEFVTVGPGVTIASHCRIGPGVMIGTGAVIAPSLTIGANAMIGAGAVVLRPVPPEVTVIGNPARIARAETGKPESPEPEVGA